MSAVVMLYVVPDRLDRSEQTYDTLLHLNEQKTIQQTCGTSKMLILRRLAVDYIQGMFNTFSTSDEEMAKESVSSLHLQFRDQW